MTREEKASYKGFMIVVGFMSVVFMFASVYILIAKLNFLNSAEIVKARIEKTTVKNGKYEYDISFDSDHHELWYRTESELAFQEGYYLDVYFLPREGGLPEITIDMNFDDVYMCAGFAFILIVIFTWSYLFPEQAVSMFDSGM